MKKLFFIFALFVYNCSSDSGGLYGPPDPFDWNYDLGVFNGDVNMYIDGVYDSTYESNTIYIASSWQDCIKLSFLGFRLRTISCEDRS